MADLDLIAGGTLELAGGGTLELIQGGPGEDFIVTIVRDVPDGVRREIDREESGELYLVFLTISHARLSEPVRVVSDPFNFVLGGETYTGFRFTISLLTDDEQAPFTKLTIQNVDRRIGLALRGLADPARIKLEVIAGSEFDLSAEPRTEIATAARTYVADQLYLTGVDADALAITGRLQTWDYAQETWPGTMATQESFPGLFR